MTGEAPPRRLLVVDDEEGLLFLMTNVLAREGYEVATANSGGQALDRLEKNNPELLLLDLNLGDMPALQLIEQLKAHGNDFPFIIITGRGDERSAVETMKVGALDYVMKDTGLMDLLPGVVRRAFSVVDREKALVSANAEQRRLEREILQISEDEKRRIGRELHDGLGQRLTALEFMSQALARSLEAKEPELSRAAAEISRHMRQTVAEVRRLSHGLAPVTLEKEGLFDAFLELAETTTASGIPCQLKAESPELPINPDAAIHLYRIAQEAVTNALKHSGANLIVLSLCEVPEGLELTVLDDGKGLPSAGQPQRGVGLHIMQYRAVLIGGKLDIGSEKEGGLRITCTVPAQDPKNR